jgi:putative intracellular protease/amidase
MTNESKKRAAALPRREFLKNSAGVILSAGVLSGAIFEPVAAEVRADTWICPPCGLDCDKLTFDKPGTCPQCGMTLIRADGGDSTPKVAILIFDGAEIIDFSGPWEAFGTAGFLVHTVAEKMEPHTMVFGQKMMPNYTFDNAPAAQVLLIPGGGVGQHMNNDKLIGWITKKSGEVDHVMSVCTGAQLLAKTGLLDGRKATITYGMEEVLAQEAPKVDVVYRRRYVESGKFITTAGLTSGIDGALYLISEMLGAGPAEATALKMEYNWQPDGAYSRAALADRFLPDGLRYAGNRLGSYQGTVLSTAGDTERWEMKISFSEPKTPPEVIKLLTERVNANTARVRGPITFDASSDPTRASWKFADEQGNAWQAGASAQADKDRTLLTIGLLSKERRSRT